MLTSIYFSSLRSDQLLTWSDEYTERIRCRLRKRRGALVRQLPPLKSILRGSLIERYKRCGKPGCKCADGPGHGPKYYLSVSYPGQRPQMDYVPQDAYGKRSSFWPTITEAARFWSRSARSTANCLRRREAL